MKESFTIETIKESVSKRLDAVKAKAITFDEARETIEQIDALSNTPGKRSKQIDALRETLRNSSVTVETLPEFRALLELVFGVDSPDVQETLAHENAHANVVQQENAIFTGYSLLVAKDGEEYNFLPGTDYETPKGWSVKKRTEVYGKILNAPDEYGNELSETDKLRLSKLEE